MDSGGVVADAGYGARARGPRALLPVHRALIQLAIAAVGGVLVAFALLSNGPLSGIWQAYLFPAGAVPYLAAGTIVWWRRPDNRIGALLVAAGAALLAVSVGNTGIPALIAVGGVAATLPLAVLIHLALTIPGSAKRVRLVIVLLRSPRTTGARATARVTVRR